MALNTTFCDCFAVQIVDIAAIVNLVAKKTELAFRMYHFAAS